MVTSEIMLQPTVTAAAAPAPASKQPASVYDNFHSYFIFSYELFCKANYYRLYRKNEKKKRKYKAFVCIFVGFFLCFYSLLCFVIK